MKANQKLPKGPNPKVIACSPTVDFYLSLLKPTKISMLIIVHSLRNTNKLKILFFIPQQIGFNKSGNVESLSPYSWTVKTNTWQCNYERKNIKAIFLKYENTTVSLWPLCVGKKYPIHIMSSWIVSKCYQKKINSLVITIVLNHVKEYIQ